jgi:hypothetical protein
MQPLSQYRSRRRGSPGGVSRTVLLGEPGLSARASQPLTRAPWARKLATSPRLPAPELTAFSQEKRRQLAALVDSEVTARLRQRVEGWTRLASLLPAREALTAPVARGGAHRVLTLDPPRRLDVLVERC